MKRKPKRHLVKGTKKNSRLKRASRGNCASPKMATTTASITPPKLKNCAPPPIYRAQTYDYTAPMGLGYLSSIFKIIIEPTTKSIDLFDGWNTNPKYIIKNMANQSLYYAVKLDNKMTIVIDCMRCVVLRISSVTSDSHANKWNVFVSSGDKLGSVMVESAICTSGFRLHNEIDCATAIRVTSSILNFEKHYNICDDLDTIGEITGWPLFAQSEQNLFAHQGSFSVCFPQDMELEQKWLLLANAFVIYGHNFVE